MLLSGADDEMFSLVSTLLRNVSIDGYVSRVRFDDVSVTNDTRFDLSAADVSPFGAFFCPVLLCSHRL